MVEAQRIDFAEWAEGNRRVCKEILTKTEPYQAGERTNSIQRRRGMWVRRVENPWSVRDIEWKCILCYRFRSKHGAGWGWYGAGHGMERGLVCEPCHKRLNGVCLCGEVLPRDFWYEG
jgi:hypothetical protein